MPSEQLPTRKAVSIWRDAGFRARLPDETYGKIRPYFPIMGITRVADVTGLDRVGIPVAIAVRPNARSISVSQGKGLTVAAAKVSAAMESIETWHAENIALPLRYSSYEDLRYSEAVVDPQRLPLEADGIFDPLERRFWVEAAVYGKERAEYLPYELVGADYTEPPMPGAGAFFASTNGLASGNSKEEALLQGLYETVERDAVTLWAAETPEERSNRTVDIGGLDDPELDSLRRRFEDAGLAVTVWSVMTDVGVPAFACLLRGTGRKEDVPDVAEFGSAAHLCPREALLRAMLEAAQVRLTVISGSRDDILPGDYGDDALIARASWAESLSEPSGNGTLAFRDQPDLSGEDPAADIETVAALLADAGMGQILTVDLTKPAFGIPVVRTVVPGLEGPWEGGAFECRPGPRLRSLLARTEGGGR